MDHNLSTAFVLFIYLALKAIFANSLNEHHLIVATIFVSLYTPVTFAN